MSTTTIPPQRCAYDQQTRDEMRSDCRAIIHAMIDASPGNADVFLGLMAILFEHVEKDKRAQVVRQVKEMLNKIGS